MYFFSEMTLNCGSLREEIQGNLAGNKITAWLFLKLTWCDILKDIILVFEYISTSFYFPGFVAKWNSLS